YVSLSARHLHESAQPTDPLVQGHVVVAHQGREAVAEHGVGTAILDHDVMVAAGRVDPGGDDVGADRGRQEAVGDHVPVSHERVTGGRKQVEERVTELVRAQGSQVRQVCDLVPVG